MTDSQKEPALTPEQVLEDLEEERRRLHHLEKRLHTEAYDKVHKINRELTQQRYITRNREKEIARLEAAKPWASMPLLILMTTFAFGLGLLVGQRL
ncbi:hypothetical protein [Synechococcus sp. KORDI-52]|uniref:hypothetical protein n=1 Tax=Synechococcus sp. KORDI-52 TaxID=585425 RepID=UPI0012EC738B|nr:hypothetical protein [Synechococcus sp. KORDI-52]